MKKLLPFLSLLIVLFGCKNSDVEKPEKLLTEEEMAAIIYDISVIDAIRAHRPGQALSVNPEYVYKKYGIDSLQFAKNNTYYASDISKYKKIYNKVSERLTADKNAADSLLSKQLGGKTPTPASELPQVQ